ncbi:hypothetical protein CMO91_02100, partial [Candidatus Woesearchaeota archaeon]|nr:hypothetical protein [Candidatus Woesearchaeota archaeon]
MSKKTVLTIVGVVAIVAIVFTFQTAKEGRMYQGMQPMGGMPHYDEAIIVDPGMPYVPGLIALYGFEGYYEGLSTLKDGYGDHDGTILGNPQVTEGFSGAGLRLDGVDDKVIIPHHDDFIGSAYDGEPFSIVVLPDTQMLADYHPKEMNRLTKWVVGTKDEFNTQFVIHVGDVVNLENVGDGREEQWQLASKSMGRLERAGIPFIVSPGNHDYDNECVKGKKNKKLSEYHAFFPFQRYKDVPRGRLAFGKDNAKNPSNANTYALFTAGGVPFIVISVEFCPSDAVLEWVNQVISEHPDRVVILSTHSYLSKSGGFANACYNSVPDDPYLRAKYGLFKYGCCEKPGSCNNGEEIYEKVVINQPQMALVVGGHATGSEEKTRYAGGQPINQFVRDYQADVYKGKKGFDNKVDVFTIDPKKNTLKVTTYRLNPAGAFVGLGEITKVVDRHFRTSYLTVEAMIKTDTLQEGYIIAKTTDTKASFALYQKNDVLRFGISTEKDGWISVGGSV